MFSNRIRLRNRVLQAFYKPRKRKSHFISEDAYDFLEELETRIEEHVTPLLASLFD